MYAYEELKSEAAKQLPDVDQLSLEVSWYSLDVQLLMTWFFLHTISQSSVSMQTWHMAGLVLYVVAVWSLKDNKSGWSVFHRILASDFEPERVILWLNFCVQQIDACLQAFSVYISATEIDRNLTWLSFT